MYVTMIKYKNFCSLYFKCHFTPITLGVEFAQLRRKCWRFSVAYFSSRTKRKKKKNSSRSEVKGRGGGGGFDLPVVATSSAGYNGEPLRWRDEAKCRGNRGKAMRAVGWLTRCRCNARKVKFTVDWQRDKDFAQQLCPLFLVVPRQQRTGAKISRPVRHSPKKTSTSPISLVTVSLYKVSYLRRWTRSTDTDDDVFSEFEFPITFFLLFISLLFYFRLLGVRCEFRVWSCKFRFAKRS